MKRCAVYECPSNGSLESVTETMGKTLKVTGELEDNLYKVDRGKDNMIMSCPLFH